jgi:hypothetical protein
LGGAGVAGGVRTGGKRVQRDIAIDHGHAGRGESLLRDDAVRGGSSEVDREGAACAALSAIAAEDAVIRAAASGDEASDERRHEPHRFLEPASFLVHLTHPF